MEAGEKIDSNDGQQILRLSVSRRKESGDVAQLVRALPCHGRGRGFEPRRPRHQSDDPTIVGCSKNVAQIRLFGLCCVTASGSHRLARLLKRLTQAHGIEAG